MWQSLEFLLCLQECEMMGCAAVPQWIGHPAGGQGAGLQHGRDAALAAARPAALPDLDHPKDGGRYALSKVPLASTTSGLGGPTQHRAQFHGGASGAALRRSPTSRRYCQASLVIGLSVVAWSGAQIPV